MGYIFEIEQVCLMQNTVLMVAVILVIFVLTLWYIWNVFFFKSWRRLFFMFLGVFLENTKQVDEYKKIEPSTRIPKSVEMKAQAETMDFEEVLEQSAVPKIPKAVIPNTETGEFARDTSYNGWPRELDEDVSHDTRPFRAIHLNTENDDIQTLVDNTKDTDASVIDDKPVN